MRQSTGSMMGSDGLQLFYRLWAPERVAANLVIAHGAGEHSGRYEHVASWFAGQGFAVWALDHRGHGRSEGVRMYVNWFEEYVADLHAFVQMAASRYGKPVLLGHSMGGLIAFRYAVAHGESIAALVLSSPWFRAKAQPTPVQAALLPVLLRLLPRLHLPAPLDPAICTKNTAMHDRDRSDPLLCGKVTPRWFAECSRAAAEVCEASMRLPAGLPVLCLQAADDLLVDPEATQAVFDRLDHDRKAFRLLPGKYHEILNDPGYEEVFAEILAWLKAQGIPAARGESALVSE